MPSIKLPLINVKMKIGKIYHWQDAMDKINAENPEFKTELKNRLITTLLYIDTYYPDFTVIFIDNLDKPISQNTTYNLYLDSVNLSKGFAIYSDKAPDAR